MIRFTPDPSPRVKALIGVMHTDIAIAEWKTAEAVLQLFDGDVAAATASILHSIGHGISDATADLLIYEIEQLARRA